MTEITGLLVVGISNLGATGIAAWFIKRWINGTSNRIEKLEVEKVDKSLCGERRESCQELIRKDLQFLSSKVEELVDASKGY